MSTGDPKQRTSASLRESTIATIENYKERNGLEHRSEALEQIVNTHPANSEPSGLMSALLQVAGDELALQLRQFAWFTIAAAVVVMAFDAGTLGTPVWAGLAVVFGFLMLTTTVGIVAGVVERFGVSVGERFRSDEPTTATDAEGEND